MRGLTINRSKELKEIELIKALEIGEKSGFVENFDSKENLKELHRQYVLEKRAAF